MLLLVATMLPMVLTTPARAATVEGEFIRVLEDGGAVYRIAGGAPVYVSSWPSVGAAGVQPYTDVSQTYVDSLPPYPADGTITRDGDNAPTNQHYRWAGGAPIVITSWANIGGEQSAIRLDPRAVTEAGSGRWSRLRQQPLDGTQITGGLPGDPENGSVFVVAGGAPVYVSDFAAVGGARAPVLVDMAAIRNAGSAQAPFRHLNYYPAEGSQVHAGSTCYSIVGGAAIAGAAGTCGTRIDPAAIANAGQEGKWSHLKAAPPPPPPPPTTPPPTTPSTPTAPPATTPPLLVRTIALTVIKKSKVRVDVGPNAADVDYEFFVQIRSRRKWRNVIGAMTRGPRDVKRIDLRRGTYRILLPASAGASQVISSRFKLRR